MQPAETIKKGTKAASATLLTISRYLRDMHSTQERIDELLSSTLSGMRFQAYLLVPAISGVVVAVADLIMRMLAQLSVTFAGIRGVKAAGMDIPFLIELEAATPPEILQLIVGIYVMEILVLLGLFINRIEVGEDKIKQNDTVWHLLLIGIVMYFVVLGMVKVLFGPLIAARAAIA